MKEILQIDNLDGQTLLGRLNFLKNELFRLREDLIEKEPMALLSRQEAARFFGVTLPTISDWSKKGIIKPYKVANRVYFRRKELEQALTEKKEISEKE